MKNSKGLTLIELLTGLVVLSLLVGLLAFSLRMLFLPPIHPYPREAISFYQLRSLIQGLYPYLIRHGDGLSFFFSGSSEEVVFVSGACLMSEGLCRIRIWFGEGALHLQELPLYSGKIDYLNPPKEGGKELVLWDDLRGGSFHYLIDGQWKDAAEGRFPSAIRIRFEDRKGKRDFYFPVRVDFYEKRALAQGALHEEF